MEQGVLLPGQKERWAAHLVDEGGRGLDEHVDAVRADLRAEHRARARAPRLTVQLQPSMRYQGQRKRAAEPLR